MFEFTVARKYLIPRVRQLSVSIITLISILVIAAVVWLSIVFFSVQEGIERRWTEKFVALTAPLRITPTDAYYASYYYQIDAVSEASSFTHKNLWQKALSPTSDPFNPEQDAALEPDFPKPLHIDLVKEVERILTELSLPFEIFDTAYATLKVQMIKNGSLQQITQPSYIVNIDTKNPRLFQSLIDTSSQEVQRLFAPEAKPHEEPILLPKSFREAGVSVGDRGTLNYEGFGATATQEQRQPITVVGFYDPGIIPIGGRVLIARQALVQKIQQSSLVEAQVLPTGFNVHIHDLSQAENIKKKLQALFKEADIAPFWNIQTYSEYDFTKDIFQQMKSDRNLFSLISLIIMVVACSNIISMLIILVHDKKREIAILRALGAKKVSIAAIFGLCGFLMGAIGSAFGSLLALVTLKNLTVLLAFLGSMQGFEVLSTAFYADTLPQEVSSTAFFFVITSCTIASSIAGIVPAIQASRINTSEALRNE